MAAAMRRMGREGDSLADSILAIECLFGLGDIYSLGNPLRDCALRVKAVRIVPRREPAQLTGPWLLIQSLP